MLISFMAMHLLAGNFAITGEGVLTNGMYSVLVYHNDYSAGKQSGIEIIKCNQRLASNGTLVVQLTNGETVKLYEVVNKQNINDSTVKLDLSLPEYQMGFSLQLQAQGDVIHIRVDGHRENDLTLIRDIYFEIELYQGYYSGKSGMTGSGACILPHDYLGGTFLEDGRVRTSYLLEGSTLSLAPEDPFFHLQLRAGTGLALYDGRYDHDINWFKIRTTDSKPGQPVVLEIHTSPGSDGMEQPRLLYPEVGFHPVQPKDILIESDHAVGEIHMGKLLRLLPDGREVEVISGRPVYWGKYYHYHYLTFNFDSITEQGLYRFLYADSISSGYFPVSEEVYDHVWQSTLTYFMPVQMCHMRVTDRYHIWHGACHLDDGLQIPANTVHFDGYRQGPDTETDFPPETTIPGMNVGGWHDAGDDDIHVLSNAINIYSLSLAVEEFGLDLDETTIDFIDRDVRIHTPDGKNDALQQIVHGLQWLLAHYRNSGHSFAGVISSSWEQYRYSGDWAAYSDNLFYDAELPEDSVTVRHSGRHDDRYVFTHTNPGREYFIAAVLASCYRILSDFDPALSRECLEIATGIIREGGRTGAHSMNTGSWIGNWTAALTELYLSTRDERYLAILESFSDEVFQAFNETAWTISRVINDIQNGPFTAKYREGLEAYSMSLCDSLARSPFGTVDQDQIWGIGWEIQWMLYKHYFLMKHDPELFPVQDMYNGIHYQLGRHPGNNISLVSGIGARRPIPAFGINRNHMHYIVGGVFSGPSKIKPDFIELKDDTPFIWQQSEYIISGAGPYIFMALATKALLKSHGPADLQYCPED